MSEFSPILAETRDAAFARTRRRAGVKKGRIKAGGAVGASGRSHLPAVRAVTGSFRCIKSGVKILPAISLLRSLSRNPYCHNKKTGVTRVSSAKRGTPFGLDAPPQKLHRMKQR